MIDRSACLAHRRALVDFVDRGEVATATARALAHLEHCQRCTIELETTVQTITVLRRLGAEAALVEPPPKAWPELRAYLERSRPTPRPATWPWRLRLGSMVAAALIVAVAVGPASTSGRLGGDAVEPSLPAGNTELALDLRAEAAFIARVGVGNRFIQAARSAPPSSSSASFNYPDGIRPAGKEVPSKRSNRWPSVAT